MKLLMALAALAVSLTGCVSHCEDYTIFSSGGCKDKCIKNRSLQCDCNHKEKCCQYNAALEKKITVTQPQ